MGACCSRDVRFEGISTMEEEEESNEKLEINANAELNKEGLEEDHNHNNINNKPSAYGDGARVRYEGSSRCISMFSQQGRKGINQDAMTVWENLNGEKGSHFCGVFDGHGPAGHRVAQQVSNLLPSKLFSSHKSCPQLCESKSDDVSKDPFFSLWNENLIKTFEEVDEDLCSDGRFDTYCSGCTAVAVLKQENHLVIANLGDSRAVLCKRGGENELMPVQLTVDLKPNLPNEAERIKSCEGRVFAMEEEPEVFRLWMAEENCPGLAMARAFGDFCLKDFGLISTPEVFYSRLTDNDEFVVLATDGVWDVLSNEEVIEIVASAKRRSTAARLIVSHAIRAWRLKYPTSRVDDCTAVCLFLQNQPFLTKSISEVSRFSKRYSKFSDYSNCVQADDGLDTLVLNHEGKGQAREKRLLRSSSHCLSRRKTSKRVLK